MDLVNAIAKVRFATAKPQRVVLHRGEALLVEMLCFEPGQEVRVHQGEWAYYVVTGKAKLVAGGQTVDVPMGQLVATVAGEAHALANAGEQRLICLAYGR